MKIADFKKAQEKLAQKAQDKIQAQIQSDKKLGNLPEDVALWIFWRSNIEENRVPARVVGKLTANRVTLTMVNNWFSWWYGIGEDDKFAHPIKDFKDLYTFFNTKRKRDLERIEHLSAKDRKTRGKAIMPNYDASPVRYPGDKKALEFINYWERQYQKRADKLLRK